MTAESILEWTRHQPFIPFELRLTDGTVHEIRYPDRIIPTKDHVLVAIPAKLESGRLASEGVKWVSLLHIMELSPLEAPDSGDNGKA